MIIGPHRIGVTVDRDAFLAFFIERMLLGNIPAEDPPKKDEIETEVVKVQTEIMQKDPPNEDSLNEGASI